MSAHFTAHLPTPCGSPVSLGPLRNLGAPSFRNSGFLFFTPFLLCSAKKFSSFLSLSCVFEILTFFFSGPSQNGSAVFSPALDRRVSQFRQVPPFVFNFNDFFSRDPILLAESVSFGRRLRVFYCRLGPPWWDGAPHPLGQCVLSGPHHRPFRLV